MGIVDWFSGQKGQHTQTFLNTKSSIQLQCMICMAYKFGLMNRNVEGLDCLHYIARQQPLLESQDFRKAREKPSFESHNRLYQVMRLKLGLKVEPRTFPRAIYIILFAIHWQLSLEYLGADVRLWKYPKEPMEHMLNVSARLCDAVVMIKLKKGEITLDIKSYPSHFTCIGQHAVCKTLQ